MAMTPAGLRLGRWLARRPGDVGEVARALLEAEGETFGEDPPPAPPSSPAGRSDPAKSPAQRAADYRARRSGSVTESVTESVTNVTERHGRHVTPNVTRDGQNVTPAPLSSSPPAPETSEFSGSSFEIPEGTRASVTPLVTSRVTAPVTRHASRNVTDDGCFGIGVQAWAEGVSSVTGKPFLLPAPRSAEMGKLIDALVASEADVGKRVEWARDAAQRFAKECAGRKLNVHAFVDWLNSPPATKPFVRRSLSDETYTPPPVSPRVEGRCKADCDAFGLNPEEYGIDRDAPPLGTAKTHPVRAREAAQ